MVDGTASFVQCVTENCEKDNRRNDTLEREEVLNLIIASEGVFAHEVVTAPSYKECTRRGAAEENRAKKQSCRLL